jgi:hypothetical protein
VQKRNTNAIVYGYASGGRTYYNTKTEVSEDGVTWTTVFDSAVSGAYAETAAGKTHTFTTRSVRYVRDWLNGSTANAGNHWVEIEVWGRATTTYVGDYFEWIGSTNTMTELRLRSTYYKAGGQTVAVRRGSTAQLPAGRPPGLDQQDDRQHLQTGAGGGQGPMRSMGIGLGGGAV